MHHACPHHARALTRYPVHGVVTWRCERCDGAWVPGAVVRKLVTEPRWPAPAAMRATMLHCPDDGRALLAWKTRGIELDCCTHCHGVWLDHGELDAIVAQTRSTDARSDNSDWHEVPEGVIDLVEAVSSRDSSGTVAAEPPALPTRVSGLGGNRFDVEYDASPQLPSGSATQSLLGTDVTVAAADAGDVGASMFESVADVAGEAMGAALEFIGEIFSAL